MTNLERYLEKVAMRPFITKNGKYHVPTLLALQLSHMPRLHEIIRVFLVNVKKNAERYPDEDCEESAEIVNMAMVAMNQTEDLALDGINMMGYEIEEINDKN